MKRTLLLLAFLGCLSAAIGQNCYWVFLTDKQGSTFDPYSYFDAKAIERYQQCGADLYDISNYPVTGSYRSQIDALAQEDMGQSRWLNAVAVIATPDQIASIEALPFVRKTVMLGADWQLAQDATPADNLMPDNIVANATDAPRLTDQLVRMQGELFRSNGIDGKGIRIAVLDAGFPHVNTHRAFDHLRKNGQILKTWNFPEKKEDVYGWNSHGTMVLSCIAGIINGQQLGLATGAEFLLARTEIDPEPFKEEVWWMQAMEWADKNGANMISSSLGYGKERHYTYEMDGRSYVAKAANMAASKGILVLCSAGNEGDDRRWKTIVTPSDADSAICVGGIVDDLSVYRHIDFSSYGPSADGRLKPNVAAFGHAIVALHSKDTSTTMAYGTSFSCPLTAGFAACAWQTRRSLTAMQMKEEIEKSADLYPYYDYAVGYGVPQASYFIDKEKKAVEPTFRFIDKETYIAVEPLEAFKPQAVGSEPGKKAETTSATVFFRCEDAMGRLLQYNTIEMEQFDPTYNIAFFKGGLYKRTLTVHYLGYTASYRLSDDDNQKLFETGSVTDFGYTLADTAGWIRTDYTEVMERTPKDNYVNEKAWSTDFAFLYGTAIRTASNECYLVRPYSPSFEITLRETKPLTKWYSLGVGAHWSRINYNYSKNDINPMDRALNHDSSSVSCLQKQLLQSTLGVEAFQRIRLKAGGMNSKGLHWDLGLYANWSLHTYKVAVNYLEANKMIAKYKRPRPADIYQINWGVSTRLTYNMIGLFANYRLSHWGDECDSTNLNLPRLTAGIQLLF